MTTAAASRTDWGQVGSDALTSTNRGNWLSGAVYKKSDRVKATNGHVYSAKSDHTSAAGTDPANENATSQAVCPTSSRNVVVR